MTFTDSPAKPRTRRSRDDSGVDLNSIVAYNFRAARRLRGWTQKETGRRLEPLFGRRVPQVLVSRIEHAYRGRRRREFDAHELLAFALVFELPIIWFLLPPPGDRRRRDEMVRALLDSRADRLDQAAAELGAFFDHVRRLGIRSVITDPQEDL